MVKLYNKIYISPVSKNSFEAYPGKVSFIISEEDPVNIIVEDFDNFTYNDFLGSFGIENKKGPFSREIKTSFDNITNAEFIFVKSPVPQILTKNLTIQESKRYGVSGYDMQFNYSCSGVSEKHQITLKPIYEIDKSDKTKFISSFRLINNDLLEDVHEINISQNTQEGEVNLFVPKYSLETGSRPGFDIYMGENKIESVITNDVTEFTKLNDIIFTLKSIEKTKINGLYGIKLSVEYEVPAMYLKDIGINNIIFNYDFLNNTKNINIKKRLRSINDAPGDYNRMDFFIPYYLFAGMENDENVTLMLNAIIHETNLVAGDTLNTFDIPFEKMANVQISNALIKYDIKNNYYSYLKIKAYHDDALIGESDELPTDKKVYMMNIAPIQKEVHPNDDITIEISGISEFNTETVIYSHTIEAIDFAGKKIKLPKNDIIKKVFLNY
ncbi:MAG: hypothetical protein Kow0068_13340 [Marinilabiliales bacterium]